MNSRSVLGFAFAASVVGSAHAVTPKYWIHDTSEEFAKGEAKGVSVTAEGAVRLAPSSEVQAEIDEPYLWDIVHDAKTNDVFVGTGDEGHVMRVSGKEASIYFQCDGLEVFSLCADGKGRLFAGAAPEGLVYRIEAENRGTKIFDAAESYPWDIEIGPDGKLYVATGSPGVVYRVDPNSGASEKFFETEDNHVVCLAFDAEGNLVLGTEGRGLVVRVDRRGVARVLYDCPQGEVSAVLPGEDGVVWAAAAVPSEVREATEPETNSDGTGLKMPFEITATTSDDAVLYRIDATGYARRAWESGQGAIYDLARSVEGHVLATTGEEGAVYSIADDGAATLLFAAEEEQVVGVTTDGHGGNFFATANPSRVTRSRDELGREGTYTSEVLDARWPATWGRVDWEGEEAGGSVKIEARSGNTENPDATWTDWETVAGANGGNLAHEVQSRFFQWRATLHGGGRSTPVVGRVRVSSLETNLAPLLKRVQVVPSGNRYYEDVPELRPRNLYQQLPGNVKVQYQFEGGGEEEFPPAARAPWAQGMRQVRWEAADPNEDALVFDLEYKSVDETRWKLIAEDVEGKNFTFDSKGVPDGIYEIRVTASDRRFNPWNERSATVASEPFIVDNAPPRFVDVVRRREGEKLVVSGRLADDASDVVRIESSLNGEDWVDVSPTDGIYDSKSEGFTTSFEADGREEHAIVLRGTDLPGNLGTSRILIEP